jgi:carboxyl-terminal processing protease
MFAPLPRWILSFVLLSSFLLQAEEADPFVQLKADLKEYEVEALTTYDVERALRLATQNHLDPQQNGLWPTVSSTLHILNSTKPARSLLLDSDIERLKLRGAKAVLNVLDKKILPISYFDAEELKTQLAKLPLSEQMKLSQNLADYSRTLPLRSWLTFRSELIYRLEKEGVLLPPSQYRAFLGLQGFLRGLDPMSEILTTHEFKGLLNSDQSIVGVGLYLAYDGKAFRVRNVYARTSAEKAGLHYGDAVLVINGKKVPENDDTAAHEMMSALTGAVGTEAVLEVRRQKTGKVETLTLKRTAFVVEESSLTLHEGVAHVRITSFDDDTAEKLAAQIALIPPSTPLVLDLRGNTGGSLNSTLSILNIFLGNTEKSPVYIRTRWGFRDAERPAPSQNALLLSLFEKPWQGSVAILVDSMSASASEILAGVLQDKGVGLVVGQRTFGKATVQSMIALDDLRYLKLTTSAYYFDSHRSPGNTGILPNLEVFRSLKSSKDSDEASLRMSGLPGVIQSKGGREAYVAPQYPRIIEATECALVSKPEIEARYKELGETLDEPADLQFLYAAKAAKCLAAK